MGDATWAHLERAVHSAPIAAGIYRIYNAKSKKSYVGQASNLRRRLGSHLRQIRLGVHSQPVLRAAFAKHDPMDWSFRIIELCARGDLTSREQYHAAALGALVCGYNCTPIQSGVEVTEEFRAIARGAAHKFHAHVSDEDRSVIAQKAAATRRERGAAVRRSEAAKKAWATRRAHTASNDRILLGVK